MRQCECSWGSPSREVRWAKVATAKPAVATRRRTPLVCWRATAALSSRNDTARSTASTWQRVTVDAASSLPRVVTTGIRIARIAGHLLARVGSGGEMAVDAMVVATAVRLGGGLILTHDPSDLRVLAAGHPNIGIAPI